LYRQADKNNKVLSLALGDIIRFTVEKLHGGCDGEVWWRDRTGCSGYRQQIVDEIVMSLK